MSPFIQRYFRSFYLLLPVLLGISLGHLAATNLGVYITPPVRITDDSATAQIAPPRKATLPEFEVIVQRNLFDSTARGTISLAGIDDSPQAARAPAPRPNLTLFGTVVRGAKSLAVIKTDNEIKRYKLQEEVPGAGVIEEIARKLVRIKLVDGTMMDLPLHQQAPSGETAAAPQRGSAPAPAAAAAGGPSAIREVGENRWVIPKEEAEKARSNINELLKQARMEPRITEGRTDGFTVRMIQPRSLLALLGIQRGDILMQVNGVTLDSPEKALQIFQQLREAQHISIGLIRGGDHLNFEYDID